MSKLVAVVDDEPDILELVSIHLKKAGFDVKSFEGAKGFLRFVKIRTPDLLVLDLMLPDMDGLEVCKYLKSEDALSGIPVIMLTARGDETDRILGLELGADDYVTKPFSPRELVARVKAVLRRKVSGKTSRKISIGSILTIDADRYEVKARNKKVDLTSTEFRILSLLASSQGIVFTREQILDHLWGHDKAVIDRTVDVHIRNLREKLGPAAKFVKNVRGVGYKLES
jgi:two-component system phosphate regulon response regulator PhoB/two-component system alkaline phosphatase synthesis response regulator PhoP